jgi:hypothetical protein
MTINFDFLTAYNCRSFLICIKPFLKNPCSLTYIATSLTAHPDYQAAICHQTLRHSNTKRWAITSNLLTCLHAYMVPELPFPYRLPYFYASMLTCFFHASICCHASVCYYAYMLPCFFHATMLPEFPFPYMRTCFHTSMRPYYYASMFLPCFHASVLTCLHAYMLPCY